ncbi:hypothetical protein ARHIZOSPH14_06400 [Agromyces rhizosphaerae]|uniref:Sugar ABC transporter ATP-binding protein n=1 Tax=Agromyces rhizosphaerae TaxID=88374 RepID=A0A9W6CQ06_9MICO|nr:hypothetical protein [Agromyces rhizosphaerae]GLI26398.1 hypothetical protein ARHIZOSPH14_06400 [Agromyces rhizosphaerae]
MSEHEQTATAEHPLSLSGISKHFGAIVAIERFDLEVEAGEVVALVGDNGARASPRS